MNIPPGHSAPATAYRVRATRCAHGWELEIGNVGYSQCRDLADAEQTARDYLATVFDLTDAEAAALAIEVVPE